MKVRRKSGPPWGMRSVRTLGPVLAIVVAAGAVTACGTAPPDHAAATSRTAAEPAGNFSLDEARRFDEFALYYVGDAFASLPLSAVLRRKEISVPAEPIAADTVSFVYGDCTPSGDSGCSPPLEVQVWPACVRSLADYELTPGKPMEAERLIIRGAPAARIAGRLEVYTGDATVVVFANRPPDLVRAANALVPVNSVAAGGRKLPTPLAGALDGTLVCGREG